MNQNDGSGISNSIKDYFKKWPRFYYFIFDFLGPVYFGGIGPKDFLKIYGGGKTVNIGSGTRRLANGIVNVDIRKFKEVDIVADINNLPFSNNEFDRVVCDQVFEHLEDPDKATSEIKRILNNDGMAYISTPFIYPFHSHPPITRDGQNKVWKDCLEVLKL